MDTQLTYCTSQSSKIYSSLRRYTIHISLQVAETTNVMFIRLVSVSTDDLPKQKVRRLILIVLQILEAVPSRRPLDNVEDQATALTKAEPITLSSLLVHAYSRKVHSREKGKSCYCAHRSSCSEARPSNMAQLHEMPRPRRPLHRRYPSIHASADASNLRCKSPNRRRL